MKRLADACLEVSLRIPVEDSQVKARLDRAYEIARGHGYTIVHVPGYQGDVDKAPQSARFESVWLVTRLATHSLDVDQAPYHVTAEECTCPDFTTARGGLCKHRLAVMLLVEQGAVEPAQA